MEIQNVSEYYHLHVAPLIYSICLVSSTWQLRRVIWQHFDSIFGRNISLRAVIRSFHFHISAGWQPPPFPFCPGMCCTQWPGWLVALLPSITHSHFPVRQHQLRYLANVYIKCEMERWLLPAAAAAIRAHPPWRAYNKQPYSQRIWWLLLFHSVVFCAPSLLLLPEMSGKQSDRFDLPPLTGNTVLHCYYYFICAHVIRSLFWSFYSDWQNIPSLSACLADWPCPSPVVLHHHHRPLQRVTMISIILKGSNLLWAVERATKV